jgi:hypothetical protein
MDIPNVAAEPNCEDGISMMTIDDSDVTNHGDASDDKRLLEIANTTLMSDPPTGEKVKPLIGSPSGDGFNVLPLVTDQPAGSDSVTPKVLHGFIFSSKKCTLIFLQVSAVS